MKLVAGVMVPTERFPNVPPATALVKKILEDAVTAVVETVTVPDDNADDVPREALEPVVMLNLFPAVPKTKLPLVAVRLPVVAVTPVPPVTVVPAATDPAVAEIFPRVATIFPAEAVTPPVVAITPVAAVTVVPEAKLVVVVKEPGVVIAEGNDTVATPAEVVTVTWFAVPLKAMISPELLAN